jgi:hypothetical protein
MTCFERRPRGSVKSGGSALDKGSIALRAMRAEIDEGGVGLRLCAAGNSEAQLAGCDEAPDTNRKRRFDVTLQ